MLENNEMKTLQHNIAQSKGSVKINATLHKLSVQTAAKRKKNG